MAGKIRGPGSAQAPSVPLNISPMVWLRQPAPIASACHGAVVGRDNQTWRIAIVGERSQASCITHNYKSLLPNGSRSTAPASGRMGRAHKRRRRRLRARNFANCRPKPALSARQKRGAVGSMRQRVFEQFICSNTTMPNCGQGVERTARRMRGKRNAFYMLENAATKRLLLEERLRHRRW